MISYVVIDKKKAAYVHHLDKDGKVVYSKKFDELVDAYFYAIEQSQQ